jgi:hypothetical protein
MAGSSNLALHFHTTASYNRWETEQCCHNMCKRLKVVDM